MAEVKKKYSQLDPGSVPATGTEILSFVQGGITKRGTISGIHGSGWWDKLKAAFVDFIAPEALHANDADTIGGETSAELHNAGALTGTAPLSAIPAELTGKNAATATSAAKLTNARTITLTGNATGSTSFDGSGNVTINTTVGYAATAGSASSAGYATSAGSASSAGYATSAGSAVSTPIHSFVAPPAALSSPGTVGQWAIGTVGKTTFLFVCVLANQWRRVAIDVF